MIVLLILGVPVALIIRANQGTAGGLQFGTFRDLTTLGEWIGWIFYGALELSLVGLFSRIFLPSRVIILGYDPIAVIGAIELAVFYASVILFLAWVYRANANAHRLGASGMRFTPGWSVGWFFVPFANLVKPYQVMRELWQSSSNPGNWQRETVPSKIVAWWGTWLAVFVFSSFDSDNPRYVHDGVLAFEVLIILLLWVQLQIMDDIQSRQMYHHAPVAQAPLDKGAGVNS